VSESGRFLERFDFREQYLASREIKAEKIFRILREEIQNTSRCSLLDVGCSQGQITERLAKEFRFVVGLDQDWEGTGQGKGFHSIQADGCSLPIRASCFDVVVLNHVLEHVSSSQELLNEVWRVLKPNGLAYLACPNRYSLIEPHYRLPFLSWLPRPLANLYVRLLGRGREYLDRLPSYWQLMNWTRHFVAKDLTVTLLKQPRHFFHDDLLLMAQTRRVGWVPSFLLKLLVPWLPVWVLIIRKPGAEALPSHSQAPGGAEESLVKSE
jgi:SAM-dependent methyltransferase